MVNEGLEQSLEGVFDKHPERSAMIIQTMDTMPSVTQDQTMAGTIRNFLHLNQISDYADRFLERKNADPAGFAPPSKPKSSTLSQQDTDKFIGRTIDFSLQSWDKKQQQKLLDTDFKAEVSPKKDAELKGLMIKQERVNAVDNKSFLEKSQDKIKNVREAITSREAVKGAVKGFLIGGKAGAVKGYCSGAVASLAKKKQDHDVKAKCDNSTDTTQDSAKSAGPKRR